MTAVSQPNSRPPSVATNVSPMTRDWFAPLLEFIKPPQMTINRNRSLFFHLAGRLQQPAACEVAHQRGDPESPLGCPLAGGDFVFQGAQLFAEHPDYIARLV